MENLLWSVLIFDKRIDTLVSRVKHFVPCLELFFHKTRLHYPPYIEIIITCTSYESSCKKLFTNYLHWKSCLKDRLLQFNPSSPLSPETLGFIRNPELGAMIHCVAFVVDGSTVDVMPEKILRQIKVLQTKMNQRSKPIGSLLSTTQGIVFGTA